MSGFVTLAIDFRFHGVTDISTFSLAGPITQWNNGDMIIGDRLRALREEKKLSQGDIETLEKLARALEVPLYQLFYDGEDPPELPNLPKRKTAADIVWGNSGKEARLLNKFRRLMGRIEEPDRRLLLYLAQKMANR